jgi:threonine dehydrogenase-like Zn-dependent dehydrogenase
MTEGSSRKLRAGVIGAGMIGGIHVRSIRLAGAEVVAMAPPPWRAPLPPPSGSKCSAPAPTPPS